MNKTIKIDQSTYESLEKLRGPRDTFDTIIKRLLRLFANAKIYRQTIDETADFERKEP